MNRNALISFIIFIIILAKYILVNRVQIISPYGPGNRIISYLIILPLMLIGTFLSLRVIKKNYLTSTNSDKPFFDIYLILSIPCLFWFLYIFGGIIIEAIGIDFYK